MVSSCLSFFLCIGTDTELTLQLPSAPMNVSIDGCRTWQYPQPYTDTVLDLSTQKALSRPSSSLPTSVSVWLKTQPFLKRYIKLTPNPDRRRSTHSPDHLPTRYSAINGTTQRRDISRRAIEAVSTRWIKARIWSRGVADTLSSIDDTDSRLGFMRLSARSRALFGDQPVLKTTQ